MDPLDEEYGFDGADPAPDGAGSAASADGIRPQDSRAAGPAPSARSGLPPRGVTRAGAPGAVVAVARPNPGALGRGATPNPLRVVRNEARPDAPAARPRGAGIAPRPGTYRGVPRPIALAAWAIFAIAVGAAIGATVPPALRRIGALIALQPSILPWYGVRAFGFLAYLALAGSVVYGLLLSTKILDVIARRPVSFALHRDLALAGLLITVVHGGLLLADRTFAFTPRAILVPFASPYASLWVGVGQVAFYAFAVITASFYVRRQIGQRTWRAIHYLTFLAFAGAAAHGIASGSDSGERWAFWLYLVPIAATVFLIVYRIVTGVSTRLGGHRAASGARREPPRSDEASASAAAEAVPERAAGSGRRPARPVFD